MASNEKQVKDQLNEHSQLVKEKLESDIPDLNIDEVGVKIETKVADAPDVDITPVNTSYSVGPNSDKGSHVQTGTKDYIPSSVPSSHSSSSSLPKSREINQGNLGSGSSDIDSGSGRRDSAPDIRNDYGDSVPSTNDDYGSNSDVLPSQSSGQVPSSGESFTPNAVNSNGIGNPSDGLERNGLDDLSDKKGLGEEKKDDTSSEEVKNDKKSDDNGDEENPNAPSSNPNVTSPQQSGLGPLKKSNQGKNNKNDSNSRAMSTLNHTKRVQQSRSMERGVSNNVVNEDKSQSTGNPFSGLKSKIQSGLSKFGLKNKGVDSDESSSKASKAAAEAKAALQKKALAFLASHPFLVICLGVIAIVLIILFIVLMDGSSSGTKSGSHCNYNLSGVTMSGEVELDGLQVELINCDGTASDYTVLETVDFEKYVLGVALAEVGESSPDEAIKAQIVAARGFALTRNSGMCPSNPDNCFYGYNVSTGKIRMRACEADQVYWDYEKDIYRQNRGSISLYSPEVNSGTLWKSALSESRKAEVEALAEEVKGKVLVDSSSNVVSTNYASGISSQFVSLANSGNTYEEILASIYSDSDGFSSGVCTSYGNIDYGDYVLDSSGNEILHQPLSSFLESNGTSLDEFNALIASNVESAGYGTRAGVVAAAVTLIAELGNNYGVKVPYYWGGGHYDGVVDGALGYWGSTECHTYANSQSYNYCGLDCSGFVPWAIKNGGFNISQMLAGNFQNLSGAQRVSLSSSAVLEPGDLLESSHHIVLVVGVDESTSQYICAEASGNSEGVLFTRRAFNSSGYWGVKMDGFYETHARSS